VTMTNARKFTGSLAESNDIDATLKNLRRVSENLNRQIAGVMDELRATGTNLKQGSDTLKRQPWRLIWPATKKYDDDNQLASDRDPESPRRSRTMSQGK
jgi:hypothetical protein